jgi:translation initiation factor IF-2
MPGVAGLSGSVGVTGGTIGVGGASRVAGLAGAAAAREARAPGRTPAVPPRQAPGVGRRPPTPADAARPRRKRKEKKVSVPAMPAKPKPELPPVPEKISLSEAVTVKELAEKLNRKSKDVIAKLIGRGVLATINQPLEPDVAIDVAKEFGSEAMIQTFEEEAQAHAVGSADGAVPTDRPEDLKERPPVVTVMGHVDHGKTSLLDSIRTTDVVAGESGGITQHIGAYQVEKKSRKITFLDTPGHEAFTLMRARGAQATDIVVLVVAADDGVKPQTIEAIDHAKAADVPIVVAINKIDKPGSQPDRVKQQLADRELMVEEYGGQTVSCEVSAKKGTGIEDLLDMILLVSDMQEFKANPDKPGSGVVLEARVDRARGVLATVLVQEGKLKIGDPFIAGTANGKVRAMSDEHGQRVDEAGPAVPVEIMGFTSEPTAGDLFQAVDDESRARQIAQFRQEKARVETLKSSARVSLDDLSRQIAGGQVVKELPVLLKADVQGSLEALQKTLGELPDDKIKIQIVRSSTGSITQADVLLASASDAIIVGFNVRPDRTASDAAVTENVEIRQYTVIYDLIDDIKKAMVGLLEPLKREVVLGQAEVRQLFKVPKIGVVGGCYVTEGKVARSAEVRLVRDNVVIYTGKVGSLRRFKDDVGEVKQGFECGIGIANYNDLKEGDVIEFFTIEEVKVESL